jgi:hypothetical protein
MAFQSLDDAQKERHTNYFDSQKTYVWKVSTMSVLSDLFLGYSKFSDFTILCGERSWPAHKAILCTQSKWFVKAMHEVSMKVSFAPFDVTVSLHA